MEWLKVLPMTASRHAIRLLSELLSDAMSAEELHRLRTTHLQINCCGEQWDCEGVGIDSFASIDRLMASSSWFRVPSDYAWNFGPVCEYSALIQTMTPDMIRECAQLKPTHNSRRKRRQLFTSQQARDWMLENLEIECFSGRNGRMPGASSRYEDAV